METSNVFNTPPPEFNQEEVLDILLKYYNIDCSIENLVSDRDQNFKIISKEQIYILKIANSAESTSIVFIKYGSPGNLFPKSRRVQFLPPSVV